MASSVLTINGGSSSVKFALFDLSAPPTRKSAGSIQSAVSQNAVQGVLEWLKPISDLNDVVAIGHRIVHGGPRYTDHAQITRELLDELHRISPIDPDHLPGEIALIEAFQAYCPGIPQIACFDTAFHRDMPAVAKQLPLPRKYAEAGVRRYGFHGLSYAYLMEELARLAGAAVANGRVILAHLGSGASMAAVRGGRCIDTTMSFTPTAGLVMGTRTGDLDPGVLVYLMRQEKMDAEQLDVLVNQRSGLLGVSDLSSDVRELLAKRSTNSHADDAIDLFCYQAVKWIGAFTAALGGLETLVFSGGIGENSAEIRSEICGYLAHLGVSIDAARNSAGASVISTDDSPATVHVIRTNEELMIAKIVADLVLGNGPRDTVD